MGHTIASIGKEMAADLGVEAMLGAIDKKSLETGVEVIEEKVLEEAEKEGVTEEDVEKETGLSVKDIEKEAEAAAGEVTGNK